MFVYGTLYLAASSGSRVVLSTGKELAAVVSDNSTIGIIFVATAGVSRDLLFLDLHS